ncbi:unnamed protein product (macronuclear) [Paramecium tetraurelia]|uniref:Uncharacterized protein n=1 Tax=Paramecium tetraurelia TaxID=5888 RepID=A0BM05_PARTE|nr:uncharacterized protein GSPATT00030206001 [Paramecium tetraurelia]CAK59572.1 unnamed protein product [Paramecium tetraurelia]|eukprot:XP_001426970.1 hypothetical protein (macronuclear) [Paramecium tetraurelia strain d4-2]
MQNQYFVKGLGFSQKQEPQETRSYGRIKKTPYSAYNNRSYNLNYHDIRMCQHHVKKMVVILNNAIKNQAATMFKYLRQFCQLELEEIKAQLRVIQEGLLRFQHAISLYNQRLKGTGFFYIAKVDVMSHLKKELRNQHSLQYQPLTHQIFRKWLKLTLELKLNRVLKQQQQNMIGFYKFTLCKIITKQDSLKVWSFNKLRITQRKSKLNRLIINLGLQYLRLNLYNAEDATYQYLRKPHLLQQIEAFQKIKHYKYFNSNQHYFILILVNKFNSKLHVLRTLFFSSIKRVDHHIEYVVPNEQKQQFDIELARQLVHCKLEHQKLQQRFIKKSNLHAPIGIFESIKTIFYKSMLPCFIRIRGSLKQSQAQDIEVQDGISKNLSILASKLSSKIKTKNRKSQNLDINLRLETIFRKNYMHERKLILNSLKKWQMITFPVQLYHDYEMRLKVLQNEKEVIMTDIEQLEILNNELMNTMNEVKKTFLSDESNLNTSKKNDQKQIEIQRFDIQDNLTSQKEIKIAFEYVDYLKEDNIDLKKQVQLNEQLMMNEIQQLEQELQELKNQLSN